MGREEVMDQAEAGWKDPKTGAGIWEDSAKRIDGDFLKMTSRIFLQVAAEHGAALPQSSSPTADERVAPVLCLSRMSAETYGIAPDLWALLPPEFREEMSLPDEKGTLIGMRRGTTRWV